MCLNNDIENENYLSSIHIVYCICVDKSSTCILTNQKEKYDTKLDHMFSIDDHDDVEIENSVICNLSYMYVYSQNTNKNICLKETDNFKTSIKPTKRKNFYSLVNKMKRSLVLLSTSLGCICLIRFITKMLLLHVSTDCTNKSSIFCNSNKDNRKIYQPLHIPTKLQIWYATTCSISPYTASHTGSTKRITLIYFCTILSRHTYSTTSYANHFDAVYSLEVQIHILLKHMIHTCTAALSEHLKISKEFYTKRYHFQVQMYGKFKTSSKTVENIFHLITVIMLLSTRTLLIEQFKYLKIEKVISENQAPIYMYIQAQVQNCIIVKNTYYNDTYILYILMHYYYYTFSHSCIVYNKLKQFVMMYISVVIFANTCIVHYLDE